MIEQGQQVATFQHLHAFFRGTFVERVEIASNCTREQSNILTDDGLYEHKG